MANLSFTVGKKMQKNSKYLPPLTFAHENVKMWFQVKINKVTEILRPFPLKWECHKIFIIFYFIKWLIQPIWAPDKQVNIVSLQNSFSWRYSNF